MNPAFVLGVDGLPYTLARRLIDQGLMPSLGRLAQRGTLAQMQTTVPDFSCVAWTSFATGVNPGKHGIYGFHDFHRRDGSHFMPTATDSLVAPLWQQVGKAGGRSVVLNIPGTYPALPLRGKLAAGFVAPDFDKACYPATFAQTLREIGYRTDFDGEGGMPDADSVRALVGAVFEARKTAIRHIIANESWDLGIAVITETDRLQHFYLAALDNVMDPDHPGVRQFYIELDAFIGEVAGMLEGKADLYLVSDHGFAVVRRTIWLDELLRQHGLAAPCDVRCWESPEAARQTRVFSLDPGRFYVNRRCARFPQGWVPESEVACIVEQLKQIMLALRDPKTGEPIIDVVRIREEGFWGDAADFAPDLVVAARAGYYLRSFKFPDPEVPIRVNWEGNHTWDDALIYVPGPMKPGVQPMIWDVLPTALSGMGVALPDEVDGRDLRAPQAPTTAAVATPGAVAGSIQLQPTRKTVVDTKKPVIVNDVASAAELAALSEWALGVYASGAPTMGYPCIVFKPCCRTSLRSPTTSLTRRSIQWPRSSSPLGLRLFRKEPSSCSESTCRVPCSNPAVNKRPHEKTKILRAVGPKFGLELVAQESRYRFSCNWEAGWRVAGRCS